MGCCFFYICLTHHSNEFSWFVCEIICKCCSAIILDDDECGGVPEEIFELYSLETLDLSCQAITSIPPAISQLVNLHTLALTGCPLLTSLPGSMGQLPNMKSKRLLPWSTLQICKKNSFIY